MKLLLSLFLFHFSSFLLSQSSKDNQFLFDGAEKIAYNNPEKALKFTQYIISNSDKSSEEKDILKAYLLQCEVLIAQKNYDAGASSLLKSYIVTNSIEDSFLTGKYYFLLSKVLLRLNMRKQFENIFSKFKNLAESSGNDESKYFQNWLLELSALQKYQEGKYDESLTLIKERNIKSNPIDPGFNDRILMIYNDILFAKNLRNEVRNNYETPFYKYLSAVNLLASNSLFNDKDDAKIKKLEAQKQFNTNFSFLPVYEQISKNACTDNNTGLCFYYKNRYLNLLKNRIDDSQNARLSILNLLQEIDKTTLENKRSNRAKTVNFIIFTCVFILIFLFGYYIYLKNKVRKSEENEKNNRIYDDLKQRVYSKNKNVPIPQKTEQILLSKLLDFENNEDYLNPKISLSFLAESLETNSKYLSEVINKHKNKNFNSYVNELRINYIITKLKYHPKYRQYKSTYLATECGYSSRTSFATIFKTISGKSLTDYIENLKNDDE